jgi:hypothetical protein
MSWTWWRAWAADIMCSRRSSVPLHRPARGDGGRGNQEILRIAGRLGAEAAAHVGGVDADLVRRQPQRGHEPLLDEVDNLGRIPRRQRIVAASHWATTPRVSMGMPT